MKNHVIFRVGRSRPPKIGCLLSFFLAIGCGISLFLVCYTSSQKNKGIDTTETPNEGINSIWEEKEFVDEFDNPTEEKFLQTPIKGTFTNSATTNITKKEVLSFLMNVRVASQALIYSK